MSKKDDEQKKTPALIKEFSYPLLASLPNESEQIARLNYMASRIRAAFCEWAKEKVAIEGVDLWWWTGFHKELVTYKT